MTREEKLIELGYVLNHTDNLWYKLGENSTMIINPQLKLRFVDVNCMVSFQVSIDAIQRDFNNVDRDFKEVMKCEQ